MNYQKIYDNLVKKNHDFQDGEYFESHHILPKSLGGKDTDNNLVRLTAREHYIAHALLVKIFEQNRDTSSYNKMLYAFNCMKWGRVDGNRQFKYNSRLYQRLKEKYSLLRKDLMASGITNPSFGKSWIYNDELRQSKLWDMNIPLPDGWQVGRKIVWNQQKKRISTNTMVNHKKNKKPTSCLDKESILRQKIELLNSMYQDYVQHGLQYVRDKYNYRKSQENLGMQFKKYVPSYDGKKLRSIAFKIKTQNHGRYDDRTKNMSVDEKKKYFTEVYRFFKQNGYDETIRHFQYNGTRNALTYNFRTYVDEYVPNKCSRWKKENFNMKNNVDYNKIFKECESYPEMLMAVTLKGGNKAKLNKFIQTKWKSCYDTSLGADPDDGMKTSLFVRQGYEFGEIPLKFIWNMLGCPKGLPREK